MSDSVRPHRGQPTRRPRPWDSPGKNTGVSCHFLLQCMKVKTESEVTQSCPTLSDPMDCSQPGSSIHGIFQARVLECHCLLQTVTGDIQIAKLPSLYNRTKILIVPSLSNSHPIQNWSLLLRSSLESSRGNLNLTNSSSLLSSTFHNSTGRCIPWLVPGSFN